MADTPTPLDVVNAVLKATNRTGDDAEKAALAKTLAPVDDRDALGAFVTSINEAKKNAGDEPIPDAALRDGVKQLQVQGLSATSVNAFENFFKALAPLKQTAPAPATTQPTTTASSTTPKNYTLNDPKKDSKAHLTLTYKPGDTVAIEYYGDDPSKALYSQDIKVRGPGDVDVIQKELEAGDEKTKAAIFESLADKQNGQKAFETVVVPGIKNLIAKSPAPASSASGVPKDMAKDIVDDLTQGTSFVDDAHKSDATEALSKMPPEVLAGLREKFAALKDKDFPKLDDKSDDAAIATYQAGYRKIVTNALAGLKDEDRATFQDALGYLSIDVDDKTPIPQREMDRALHSANAIAGGPRDQELLMQGIIKTGIYDPDYARDKFGTIDKDDLKKAHDKLMEYADKTSGVIPDDKKQEAGAAARGSLSQTLSQKEDDIRQVAALLGRPANEPDSDSATPGQFHYGMARLSSNTVHVFRKTLEDAQKAAGDKPLSKEDIDKAMQVAIKAGDDEATSGSAWDRAAAGDTDKFMHMAVNSPAGQLLQPDPAKPADATTPAAQPASSAPAPDSSATPKPETAPAPGTTKPASRSTATGKPQSKAASRAAAPADVTAETVNGTVFGSYVNHGHHYGVIANQQGTSYIAEDGKVRSENDHTAKFGIHSSDGSADVLMAAEQARMHPAEQQQTAPGAGASPPMAYAQPQQGGVINAGMQVPGGGYPIPASPSGWGYYGALVSPGGYYDYGHGKPGYTIPGTDAYHSPGTNAYHSPGINAFHSPGTNAFHSPGITGPKR